MRVAPFALERFFAAHEFSVDYVLSASDCESLSLAELLALADDETRALWDGLRLGYTESQGHPLLRSEAARLYRSIRPQDVLIAAPEELIFLAMNALLVPGDHVIVTHPGYQSLYAVAEALGCRVTRWPLRLHGDAWRLDLDFLADHLTDETRLVVINFPHNPTGSLIAADELGAIVSLARRRGAYLFSDEMYRLLELDPAARLPSICDLYERGITLSGLSKAFGLPGLRLGWLALRDAGLLERLCVLRDYTTICNSAPGEILGIMALRAQAAITERNLELIRANLALAGSFFARRRTLFRWLPPAAGSVAFPQWLGEASVETFCEDVLTQESVLILPGRVFEVEGNHFRVGLGRADFPAALGRLEAYLAGFDSASQAGQRFGSASS
jgi:aspartate/methionine/tyrosine aminotransferase